MTENIAWSVFPHDANRTAMPLTEDEKKNAVGLNTVGAVALWIVIWVVFSLVVGTLISLVLATLAAIAAHVLLIRKNVALLERKKAEEANRRDIEEAKSLTSRLQIMYESSAKFASQLQGRLDDGFSWLPYAEDEYKSNAFGSFWDAIEKSTLILGDFHQLTNALTQNAAEYYRSLNGRIHSFPPFPVQNGSIPDPTFTLGELQRIARLGQTNFEFANIWEHRKTRKVLIAGFRNLGDAIYNLGSTIENSLSNLEESISSDVARIVEEEISTRDRLDTRMHEEGKSISTALSDFKKGVDKKMNEQTEMIDNIQRGRKPGVFGGFTNE